MLCTAGKESEQPRTNPPDHDRYPEREHATTERDFHHAPITSANSTTVQRECGASCSDGDHSMNTEWFPQ